MTQSSTPALSAVHDFGVDNPTVAASHCHTVNVTIDHHHYAGSGSTLIAIQEDIARLEARIKELAQQLGGKVLS